VEGDEKGAAAVAAATIAAAVDAGNRKSSVGVSCAMLGETLN